MKISIVLLASALAVNSQGVSERLKELTVQEEQKDADEYMLLPNADMESARRRLWEWGKGPPTNDWTVDPNKYHAGWARPNVSKLRWMLFREDDTWDYKQTYRGAEVWAPGWDAWKSTKFDPSKPTMFYCEGFTSDSKRESKIALDLVSENYPDGMNLIIIDASDGFFKNFNKWLGTKVDLVYYPNAAHNTQDVGYQSAKIYESLLKKHGDIRAAGSHTMIHANKVSWNVQCLGGSLGAQTCGRFGRTVKALTGIPVNRVTALDAAGPLFHKGQPLAAYAVNKNDAYFVEGVHVNGKHSGKQAPEQFLTLEHLGLEQPYGHVDYYVNGGIHQPGCENATHKGYCSHARMRLLWGTASRGNEHKTTKCKNYAACQCEIGNQCDSRAKDRLPSDVKMGQFGTINARGLYFVETSANKKRGYKLDGEPFVKPDGTIDYGTRPIDGPGPTQTDAGNGLENAGKDCWKHCDERSGPCDWCGSGKCCRKGYKGGENGCGVDDGGDNFHGCVAGTPGYVKIDYPSTQCPSGYTPVSSSTDCKDYVESVGGTYVSDLTNDGNWVSGCFEWWNGGAPANSGRYYVNYKTTNPDSGNIGGHRVCKKNAGRRRINFDSLLAPAPKI